MTDNHHAQEAGLSDYPAPWQPEAAAGRRRTLGYLSSVVAELRDDDLRTSLTRLVCRLNGFAHEG
jgi:hypothetical protein